MYLLCCSQASLQVGICRTQVYDSVAINERV